MESNLKNKQRLRNRRKLRVRKHLFGTPSRPRLSLFKSNTNIYGQIINDEEGKTLAAYSSLNKSLNLKEKNKNTLSIAQKVGEALAKIALEKGIKEVCFDRGCLKYHGAVKAFAQAAREAGLQF